MSKSNGRKRASVTVLNMRGGQRTVPAPKCPKAPKALSGEALTEWNRLARLLWEHDLLTKSNLPEFATYCQTWADYAACQKEIAALKSPLVKGPRGGQKVHPLYTRRNQIVRRLMALTNKLGLNPRSRARRQQRKRRTRG